VKVIRSMLAVTTRQPECEDAKRAAKALDKPLREVQRAARKGKS